MMSKSDADPDIPRIVSLSTGKGEDKTKRDFEKYIAQEMSSKEDIALKELLLKSHSSKINSQLETSAQTTERPQNPSNTSSHPLEINSHLEESTQNTERLHQVQLDPDPLKEVNNAIKKLEKHYKIPKSRVIIISAIITLIILATIVTIVTFAVLIGRIFEDIEHLKVPSYPHAPIVVGNWSEWSNWSQCSATCGHGLQNRIRTCSDLEPSTGGKHCPGQNVEYQMCNLPTCTGDIAAFSWKFKIQNGTLTFPDRPPDKGKIYEHGNGFNPDNGVFTCSKPGIYLFSVTLVKEESNSNLTCHLYKTEPYPYQLTSLILNSSNYSSNSFSYASATVTVELKRNDTVYISSCSASSSSSKAYSVFTGVLLHQII